MNTVDIIVKKRDGYELTAEEIEFFIRGYCAGRIPDYQAAAWAMAVYFRGMTDAETTELTLAMAATGVQLDLHPDLPSGTVIVDKHSSGGVGDKTSLVVAPIAAACGLPVGKMSGRGLSFSGGTIDKLESIPGWTADLDEAQFRHQLATIGLVIAGQTVELAEADKALYALRDVTGTVPSLPLIASSIMSKKLAAGADVIVLDVKCGRGAFMATRDEAHRLASLMVAIGTRAGRRVAALITQMEEPLGNTVGNALEVREAIEALQGKGPQDLRELAEVLAIEIVVQAAKTPEERVRATARRRVVEAIESGAALAKFREFVAAQGGDTAVVDDPDKLPRAPVVKAVLSPRRGWVQQVDAREVGLTVVELGGGRVTKADHIDPSVGVVFEHKVGARVAVGEPLCTIHAASEAAAARAAERLAQAFVISDTLVAPLPMIYGRVESGVTNR